MAPRERRPRPKQTASAADPDLIYDTIKSRIVAGELPPGTKLVETLLAEEYSVSRTPVREALGRLADGGLVERVHRTMRVRGPSPEEILELYEIRALLEGAAAELAASRHNAADAIALRTLMERMRGQEDVGDRIALNWRFHAAIWRASHNSMLEQTLERLYTSNVRHLPSNRADDERWTETVSEHQAILDAILEREPERASELVRRHLEAARDLRLAQIS